MSKKTRTETQAAAGDTARNVMIVSAFGFWAMVLGFVPVVAIHALIV